MNQNERTSIKATIRYVMEWIRTRKPGPASVDWVFENTETPLILNLTFSSLDFTQEEINFLPAGDRLSALNGSTPDSLSPLDLAHTRLTEIGGHLGLWRSPQDGLSLQLAFPGNANNITDATDKIRLIQKDIMDELRHHPPS